MDPLKHFVKGYEKTEHKYKYKGNKERYDKNFWKDKAGPYSTPANSSVSIEKRKCEWCGSKINLLPLSHGRGRWDAGKPVKDDYVCHDCVVKEWWGGKDPYKK